MRFLLRIYHSRWGNDKEFCRIIKRLSGVAPSDPAVYRLAFKHSSTITDGKNSAGECNERLEYLGDSVFNTVIAEYLFKKYPLKNEGFLTEMRSKIVSRATMNDVGRRMGLDELIEYNKRANGFNRSMSGNALEAFIGAIYLDLGYVGAKRF